MIRAHGLLRHRFHGEYSAVIGLQFTSESDAIEARRSLGIYWRHGHTARNVLVRVVESASLDAVKEDLARFNLTITPCGRARCKAKHAIDDVAHSIDVGAQFTIDVPYLVPVEQCALPGVA